MGDAVLIGGIAFAAYYLLKQLGFVDAVNSGTTDPVSAIVNHAAQVLSQQQQIEQATAPRRSGAGGIALASSGAGTAVGVASAAGLAASTTLLATGIGAAAGLLVWGIVQKGWFRGGQEGVQVNPARDQFIQVWIDVYYPGEGSARQFDAMVRAFADAGVPGNIAEQTIRQLYAADTMDEFNAAAQNFLRVLKGQ